MENNAVKCFRGQDREEETSVWKTNKQAKTILALLRSASEFRFWRFGWRTPPAAWPTGNHRRSTDMGELRCCSPCLSTSDYGWSISFGRLPWENQVFLGNLPPKSSIRPSSHCQRTVRVYVRSPMLSAYFSSSAYHFHCLWDSVSLQADVCWVNGERAGLPTRFTCAGPGPNGWLWKSLGVSRFEEAHGHHKGQS